MELILTIKERKREDYTNILQRNMKHIKKAVNILNNFVLQSKVSVNNCINIKML